jgi:transcription-repair coupling factor (superfamily II helicase)
MRDMAEELLKLYAARKANPATQSPTRTGGNSDAFEYDLTPDQSPRSPTSSAT